MDDLSQPPGALMIAGQRQPDCNDDAITLQRFLLTPRDRQAFDAFFKVCYRETQKSLRYLQACGYRLPLDDTDSRRARENLTIDILGSFLRSDPGRPFFVVYDFFSGQGHDDLQQAAPDLLQRQFLGLLRNYVRQELYRLRNEADPQAGLFKRRVHEIIRDGNYRVVESDTSGAELVMRGDDDAATAGTPPTYDQLFEAALTTHVHSKSTTEWCRAIFTELQDEAGLAPAVKKNELLHALMTVHLKYVDMEGFRYGPVARPLQAAVREELERVRKETLAETQTGLLAKFMSRGRLQPTEADALLQALGFYLDDYFLGGEADAIPLYFREALPSVEQKEYLKGYKYVFDTLVGEALRLMQMKLRECPTIRSLRFYLLDDDRLGESYGSPDV